MGTSETYYTKDDLLIERNGSLYLYDYQNSTYSEICRSIHVTKVTRNISTNIHSVEIQLIDLEGKARHLQLPRENFTKLKLLNILSSYGLDITDTTSNTVLKHLIATEKTAKKLNVHDNLGWYHIEGKRVFLSEKLIGMDIDSTYSGPIDVTPKGTLQDELDTYFELTHGHIPAQLALVLGFSSMVLSLVREFRPIENIVVALVGLSSTGKTSMLSLIAGPYSRTDSNGIIMNLNATPTSIISSCKGIHGYPKPFDESTISEGTMNHQPLIYSLSAGKDKARANVNGDLKFIAEFSGLYATTGEVSMLNGSNHHAGISMRLLEFKEICWTRSSQHSREIKERMLDNYGNLGPDFASFLIAKGDQEIVDMFDASRTEAFSKMVNKDRFSDRASDRIGIFLMTGRMLNEEYNLGIDIEGILEMLLDTDSGQIEERDPGRKAYEWIKSEMTRLSGKFVYKGKLETFNTNTGNYGAREIPRNEVLGCVEYQGSEPHYAFIIRSALPSMLENGGFTSTDTILKLWKDAGIIISESGKHTVKKVIIPGMKEVRAVKILLANNSYENIDKGKKDEGGNVVPLKKKILKKIPRMNDDIREML